MRVLLRRSKNFARDIIWNKNQSGKILEVSRSRPEIYDNNDYWLVDENSAQEEELEDIDMTSPECRNGWLFPRNAR